MSVRWVVVALVTLAAPAIVGCGGNVESAAVDDAGSGPAESAKCAAVTTAGSAYQAALDAATSCDPSSNTVQCPGGSVTGLYGCMFPANSDQASRAKLVAAIADYQAAVMACGMGSPYTPGCQGWPPNAVMTCLPAGDAGGGVCSVKW